MVYYFSMLYTLVTFFAVRFILNQLSSGSAFSLQMGHSKLCWQAPHTIVALHVDMYKYAKSGSR